MSYYRDQYLLELEKEKMAKRMTKALSKRTLPTKLTFTERLKLRNTANNIHKKGK